MIKKIVIIACLCIPAVVNAGGGGGSGGVSTSVGGGQYLGGASKNIDKSGAVSGPTVNGSAASTEENAAAAALAKNKEDLALIGKEVSVKKNNGVSTPNYAANTRAYMAKTVLLQKELCKKGYCPRVVKDETGLVEFKRGAISLMTFNNAVGADFLPNEDLKPEYYKIETQEGDDLVKKVARSITTEAFRVDDRIDVREVFLRDHVHYSLTFVLNEKGESKLENVEGRCIDTFFYGLNRYLTKQIRNIEYVDAFSKMHDSCIFNSSASPCASYFDLITSFCEKGSISETGIVSGTAKGVASENGK